MKLMRFALGTYEPSLDERWSSFGLSMDGADVKAYPYRPPNDTELCRHTINAEIKIDLPTVEPGGLVLIPEGPRLMCEAAIETLVNTVALFNALRRQIQSTRPSVALVPESDEEQRFLDEAEGLKLQPQGEMAFLGKIVPSQEMLLGLNDRMTGVALLAEAYAHGMVSGRFREWVRFFEAAFRREFTALGKKLAQTLNPILGYSREEIETWIAKRHPFTHADGKQTSLMLMERDARGISRRMEQAALDIIFNKKDWGVWSSERRALWQPTVWSKGPARADGYVVQQTEDTKLSWAMMDEFDVYPQGMTTVSPPENWLFRTKKPPKSQP